MTYLTARSKPLSEVSALLFSMADRKKDCYLWPLKNCQDGAPVLSSRGDSIHVQVITYSWYYAKGLNPLNIYFTCGHENCINPEHMLEEYRPQVTDETTEPEAVKRLANGTIKLLQKYQGPAYRARRQRNLFYGLRNKVLALDNNECVYCGVNINLSIDHVIPFSKGGKDHIDNLVTACFWCNISKYDHTPEEANMQLLYGRFRLLKEEVS